MPPQPVIHSRDGVTMEQRPTAKKEPGETTQQPMSCAGKAALLPWTDRTAFFAIAKGGLVTMDASSKPARRKVILRSGSKPAQLPWLGVHWLPGKRSSQAPEPKTTLRSCEIIPRSAANEVTVWKGSQKQQKSKDGSTWRPVRTAQSCGNRQCGRGIGTPGHVVRIRRSLG